MFDGNIRCVKPHRHPMLDAITTDDDIDWFDAVRAPGGMVLIVDEGADPAELVLAGEGLDFEPELPERGWEDEVLEAMAAVPDEGDPYDYLGDAFPLMTPGGGPRSKRVHLPRWAPTSAAA